MQYEGNVNLYTRLPVHVDETESILHTGLLANFSQNYTELKNFIS